MADIERTATITIDADDSQAQKKYEGIIKWADKPIQLTIDADIKDALNGFKKLQQIIDELTNQSKDKPVKFLNVSGITKMQKQLEKLGTTLEEISNKIAFDNIRPSKMVENDIDNLNEKLKKTQDNLDRINQLRSRNLVGKKAQDVMGELFNPKVKNVDLGDSIFKNYIKYARELADLGGDLSKVKFNFNWIDEKGVKQSGVFSALDVIQKMKEKGALNVDDIIDMSGKNKVDANIDDITSKLKELDQEREQALAKEGRSFTVGLDEASIKAVTEALQELNKTIGGEEGKSLGIKEEDLKQIVGAIDDIKNSLGDDIKLGLDDTQIESVVSTFKELRETLESIATLLSQIDFSKVKINMPVDSAQVQVNKLKGTIVDMLQLLNNFSISNMESFNSRHNGILGLDENNVMDVYKRLMEYKNLIKQLTRQDPGQADGFLKDLNNEQGLESIQRRAQMLEKLGYQIGEIKTSLSGSFLQAEIIPIPDKAVTNAEEMLRILLGIQPALNEMQNNDGNIIGGANNAANEQQQIVEKLINSYKELYEAERLASTGYDNSENIARIKREQEDLRSKLVYDSDKKRVDQAKLAYTRTTEMDTYEKDLKRYKELYLKQQRSQQGQGGIFTSGEQAELDQVYGRLITQQNKWNSELQDGIELTSRQKSLMEEMASVQSDTISKIGDRQAKSMINTLDNQLSKLKSQSGTRTDEFDLEVEKYEEAIRHLKSELENIDFSQPDAEEQIRRLTGDYEDLRVAMERTANSDEFKFAKFETQNQLFASVEQWANRNKRAAKEFADELDLIRERIGQINTRADKADVVSMFEGVKAKAESQGLTGRTLGDRFTNQLKNSLTNLATYYLSFQDFIRYGRETVQVITDLDTALTEMRKVSDESLTSLQNYQIESFSTASDLGTTAVELQQSTADWLRLGRSFENAKEMAALSTKLLNVSEFTSIEDATKALVSATQAYTEVAGEDIVDKLNLIGNNFAVSTDELARGLQNAAAVLKTQGNDLDQTLALLTAGNLIGQDMSKASAGIRTIALRIAGTKEAKNEIADLGEDVDDFVVRTTSKTDKIIRDYTAVASNMYQGVSVLDANGNLRDTYDILLDISKIYKEIQETDKIAGTNRAQALVEELAGIVMPGNIEIYF